MTRPEGLNADLQQPHDVREPDPTASRTSLARLHERLIEGSSMAGYLSYIEGF
jgi:hypothetical protein